jgi:hypothetical protein
MALEMEKRLEVTRDILRMAQGTMVSMAQVEGILATFKLPTDDYEARIFLLSRLAEVVRELSMKTFRSDEHRLHIIDAIQSSLDRYIEEEDVVVDEVN